MLGEIIWQGEDLSPLKLGELPFLDFSFQWFIKCQDSSTSKYFLLPLPQEKTILQGLLKAGGTIAKEMTQWIRL